MKKGEMIIIVVLCLIRGFLCQPHAPIHLTEAAMENGGADKLSSGGLITGLNPFLSGSPQLRKSKTFQKVSNKFHPNSIMNDKPVGMIPNKLGNIPHLGAVQGSSVSLPCNITPPVVTDKVRLVLFFRNISDIPIYTYDTRGQSHLEARHWSDETILGGRAFFRGDQNPARLILDNVQPDDGGIYRCRVDFYRTPTTIESVALDVIVPPEKPIIFDERGQEVRLKLGPYKVGENILLKCTAKGGHPSPRLTWWRDHALLDDSIDDVGTNEVTNELRLVSLKRNDLHAILTCQASNNNISVPASTSVKLDMHFGPLDVKMIGRKDPVSAGRVYEFRCQAVGARPSPIITWWRGSTQLRENVTNKTSPDGNVTLSIINYVPSVRDAGKYMSCRAENPDIADSSMEDGWKLEIHYTPQSVLSLGTSLNGSNIKEGDDVYFECNVRANPRPYKISWRFNESPLIHNVLTGIIISNQSLVLQNVKRDQSGIYTCLAHNIEGDGVSNPMTLNIRYAPYCKPDQVQVFGVAREETIRISCEVESNPIGSTTFEWKFNASGEIVDMPHDRFRSTPTKSIVEYVPRTELDYGSLLCWATNSIGRQRNPCIFHLIPAGTPDSVRNCSFGNQTTTSLQVRCNGGYDGGLPQSFVLEAKDNHNFAVVSKIQNTQPRFNVTGLRPGRSYVLTVYSQNAKGPSSPVTLYSFTIKEAEKHMAGSTIPANVTSRDGIHVTPVLGILVAVGCGLALVAVAIILVLRLRPTGGGYRRRRQKSGSDMTCRSSGSGSNGGLFTQSGGATHIPLRQRNEMRNMEEKEPDLIPHNKDMVEDVFNSYHEQNQGLVHQPSSLSATMTRRKPDDSDMERRKKIRNNFSRLSQEVTYAELTMPRNKGYAPMIARPSDPSSSFNNTPQSSPSIQKPQSANFKVRYPPAPPPRYTSPPTLATSQHPLEQPLLMDRDDPNLSDMPLVSSNRSSNIHSSLPVLRRNSDSTSSADIPLDESTSSEQRTSIGRMRKIRNKHMEQIRFDRDSNWTSLPETMEEQYEEGDVEYRNERSDLNHRRHHPMLSKLREYPSQTASFDERSVPFADGSKDHSVPPELLEKRRVLMRTLSKVNHRSLQSTMSLAGISYGRRLSQDINFLEKVRESEPLQQEQQAQHLHRLNPHRKLVRWNSEALPRSPPDTYGSTKRRELPTVPVDPINTEARLVHRGVSRQHSVAVMSLENNSDVPVTGGLSTRRATSVRGGYPRVSSRDLADPRDSIF